MPIRRKSVQYMYTSRSDGLADDLPTCRTSPTRPSSRPVDFVGRAADPHGDQQSTCRAEEGGRQTELELTVRMHWVYQSVPDIRRYPSIIGVAFITFLILSSFNPSLLFLALFLSGRGGNSVVDQSSRRIADFSADFSAVRGALICQQEMTAGSWIVDF